MKLKNRIFAFILVLALCVSMTPFSVFAETADASFPEVENQTLDILPTEEKAESDEVEESPIPAEKPEQEQGPATPAESPTVAPTEPTVSEGEATEEPQPEPVPTAAPEPEYVPGFTVSADSPQRLCCLTEYTKQPIVWTNI